MEEILVHEIQTLPTDIDLQALPGNWANLQKLQGLGHICTPVAAGIVGYRVFTLATRLFDQLFLGGQYPSHLHLGLDLQKIQQQWLQRTDVEWGTTRRKLEALVILAPFIQAHVIVVL